jgi:LysM repeat protein
MSLCSVSVFSQDKNIKHSIVKGETISSIAEKYNVSAASIYQLNPKSKKTLQLNQVLLIPSSETKKENKVVAVPEKTTEIKHEVLPKETLYGIVKQYKTTNDLLYSANPQLEAEGLKIGQIISIPSRLSKKEISNLSNKNSAVVVETESITHQVKPKESLYSIAKQYSVTIKELNDSNPKIGKKGLIVGQLVIIPSNGKLPVEVAVVEDKVIQEATNVAVNPENKEEEAKAKETEIVQEERVVSKEIGTNTLKEIEPLTHKVKSGESLYVIAKQYSITLKELKDTNPKIVGKGLSIGQMIVIPGDGKLVDESMVVVKSGIEDSGIAIDDKKLGTDIIHEVQPKETKYGIAKKYGITVKELEAENPKILQGLLVGSKLKIIANQVDFVTGTDVSKTIVKNEAVEIVKATDTSELVEQLIETASGKIGTRYRSGGTTPAGFDCSGLMINTFGAFDIKLPRSSIEQADFGTRITAEDAQKGDLIFFKTNGRGRINHVGMVVEVNEGEIKFIHSATHGGVIVSSTKESYYSRNFAQVNRVLQ